MLIIAPEWERVMHYWGWEAQSIASGPTHLTPMTTQGLHIMGIDILWRRHIYRLSEAYNVFTLLRIYHPLPNSPNLDLHYGRIIWEYFNWCYHAMIGPPKTRAIKTAAPFFSWIRGRATLHLFHELHYCHRSSLLRKESKYWIKSLSGWRFETSFGLET